MEADLPPQGVKPHFKTDKLWEMKVRLSQSILDTVGGRAIHFDQCSYPLLAPPNFKAFFLDHGIMGRMGEGSSKRFSYHPKDFFIHSQSSSEGVAILQVGSSRYLTG